MPSAAATSGQPVVAGRVEGVTVVPQLDPHPVTAEDLDQALGLPTGRGRPLVDQGLRHGALAAAGERHQVAEPVAHVMTDLVQRQPRAPFSPAICAALSVRLSAA